MTLPNVELFQKFLETRLSSKFEIKLEVWANAQRDGRPAEYRWRPLFNAATFGKVIGGKVDCLNFLKHRGTVLLKNKQG